MVIIILRNNTLLIIHSIIGHILPNTLLLVHTDQVLRMATQAPHLCHHNNILCRIRGNLPSQDLHILDILMVTHSSNIQI